MTNKQTTVLVSPLSRLPLILQDNRLITNDGKESFSVEQGIELLLDRSSADDTLNQEMKVFDNLNVRGLSYFRPLLYQKMIKLLCNHLKKTGVELKAGLRFAELGGGEGHCARYILKNFEQAEVFVCDASMSTLKYAPHSLRRIWADITKPIFAPKTLQTAAFWVSLHHLNEKQRSLAIEEAFIALEEGGVLIVFEPNDAFILRRLLYISPLRHDVYFDDREEAVSLTKIEALAKEIGFEPLETIYLNPPYNPSFVRQLKRSYLYLPIVESLHVLSFMLSGIYTRKHIKYMRHLSLYGMSFFRKPYRSL
ncbi:MAG: class I SAM-dependent methyltransferase [Nitrospirae bacterium]|nr:class I SAM-dependent methyltransferase [Nitrospirota bacterium]